MSEMSYENWKNIFSKAKKLVITLIKSMSWGQFLAASHPHFWDPALDHSGMTGQKVPNKVSLEILNMSFIIFIPESNVAESPVCLPKSLYRHMHPECFWFHEFSCFQAVFFLFLKISNNNGTYLHWFQQALPQSCLQSIDPPYGWITRWGPRRLELSSRFWRLAVLPFSSQSQMAIREMKLNIAKLWWTIGFILDSYRIHLGFINYSPFHWQSCLVNRDSRSPRWMGYDNPHCPLQLTIINRNGWKSSYCSVLASADDSRPKGRI